GRGVWHCLQFVFPQGVPQRRQAGLRLLSRYSGLEPADYVQPSRTPIIQIVPSWSDLRLHHHRGKHVWRGAYDKASKSRRSDSHNRKWMTVDDDAVIDHMRIGAEAALPITIAKDRDRIFLLRLIIGLHQQTA